VNAINAHTLISPVIPPHPASPYDNWLAAFPLRTFLELGAYETAPGAARGHVRNALQDWHLHMLAESVLLVLSELVTNAVAATHEVCWEAGLPPVRLWALGGADASGAGASGGGEVLLLVWDAVPDVPTAARQPDELGELEESGRGLWIVNRYSTSWDFYRPRWPDGGKVARALIDRPCPPDDD
jgi:anti-sigma regulatory factor (Ser/Thr protein kinase)